MALSTRYNPQDTEDKWYAHWMAQQHFRSVPDEREPYSIVIPPPNVTGVLHMGHMLNNTIQDILIRKARLDGKNACWVPGTDHASIATEAKVVKMLREQGIKKSELSREAFLEHAWAWTHKYGGTILQQLRKLGASCDWERTAFTLDETRSAGVIKVFVDLYRKGKLYRDYRMVNWDPEAKTVLSNEEVLYAEENSTLYHLRYPLADGSGHLVIATTRPETILGDTAVAVHPEDARYAHLRGKALRVPLIDREIPIIFDDYVDREFGTGALKVTPAHDTNDYEIGKRHQLAVIDILHEDGRLNEHAQLYVGQDRFAVRKQIAKDLEAAGYLEKAEPYRNNVGRSERTGAVVEPRLSLQWYVDMKALAQPALDVVMSDELRFFPEHFKNTYRHWMANIRDWCISRQLWWGHRVPAWYYGEHTFVAESAEEALAEARARLGQPDLQLSDLKQDEDALDTWFSSWLWPITVFDGFNPESKDFPYYYPTNVLVTGWDIIFLWVARMVMAGFEWTQERPFHAVYFTGMVRDKQGRKMSKQLGNSPDALQLIADYGADGVRFGLLSSSPAGGDLLFDDKLCEQGRNFANKMWNALRLVKGWQVGENSADQEAVAELAHAWLRQKFQQLLSSIEADYRQYRLSEIVKDLYNFIWDDFCAWYLEMVKPEASGNISAATLERTLSLFEQLMVVLHPFMPFVTEEIWHQLRERQPSEDCVVARHPQAQGFDTAFLAQVETAKGIVSQIRDLRNKKGIKQSEALSLLAVPSTATEPLLALDGLVAMLRKMAHLDHIGLSAEEPTNAVSFIAGAGQYFVPLQLDIDVEAERGRLEKELAHQRAFVASVEKKLGNERFVSSAPAQVVENERKKLADGQARIHALEAELARLA